MARMTQTEIISRLADKSGLQENGRKGHVRRSRGAGF